MSNRTQLRSLGYSADADGNIVCHAEVEGNYHRYVHERCGVIRIDLERNSKSGLELVERLIAAVDEPRALVGRSRNGAVLLFRVSEHGDIHRNVELKLVSNAGEHFAITYGSVEQTLDVNAYNWPKGRSPLDVERDSLAMLFDDVGKRVVDAALRASTWAPTAQQLEDERQQQERLARLREEIAAGLHDPEARAAREDQELVARFPDATVSDGPWTQIVFQARDRIRARLKAAVERKTA